MVLISRLLILKIKAKSNKISLADQGWQSWWLKLALLKPILPLDKNQSIDLQCKLIGWILYNGNIGFHWVN